MLGEALAALASTGGTALVTAMVTDSWESIEGRVAHLFGRGDAKRTAAAEERLEQSRAAIEGLAGTELDRARAEQEIVWRTRLADLLEAHPEAAGELKSLIGTIQHSAGPPFGLRDDRLPMRGRDVLLEELNSPERVHLLHGLGGCGKTRLALEVANRAELDGTETSTTPTSPPSWPVPARRRPRVAGGSGACRPVRPAGC